MAPPLNDLAATIAELLRVEGIQLDAIGLAWARVAPAVTLVPAFGLRATPATFRIAAGLLLAVSIAPALVPAVPPGPWTGALLRSLLAGVPLALGATLPLWIATTAGGLVDALRGSTESSALPTLEGRHGAFGALWGLLACAGFLASGGPARVALAALDPPTFQALPRVVLGLVSGVSVAVAVAAPMLAASILLELSLALITRAAAPASLAAILSLGRNATLLLLGALFFERMAMLVLTLSPMQLWPQAPLAACGTKGHACLLPTP
ncbi:MAG: flagellar biosynthetic protein FliR [Myxococcales bacterium]|nr:flagellar biosynthetic protein FliR [Polyangiaceae bacterium]MDW8250701.1 flagellar biosynthetic protein FliR [Myxococcales bacterium]